MLFEIDFFFLNMKTVKFILESEFTLPLLVGMLVLLVLNLSDNSLLWTPILYYVSNICSVSS